MHNCKRRSRCSCVIFTFVQSCHLADTLIQIDLQSVIHLQLALQSCHKCHGWQTRHHYRSGVHLGGATFYNYHHRFSAGAASKHLQWNVMKYWGALDMELYCCFFSRRVSLARDICRCPSQPTTLSALVPTAPDASPALPPDNVDISSTQRTSSFWSWKSLGNNAGRRPMIAQRHVKQTGHHLSEAGLHSEKKVLSRTRKGYSAVPIREPFEEPLFGSA